MADAVGAGLGNREEARCQGEGSASSSCHPRESGGPVDSRLRGNDDALGHSVSVQAGLERLDWITW